MTAAGLKPTIEDIQWLRIMDLGVRGDIPDFNKSRLIAMGLVIPEKNVLRLTDRGRALLTATPKTA
jgi:hypothetical protein